MDARVVHTIAGEAGRSWWGPGDMYTFLVTGEDSGGSLFALDCLVGSGGGPPPHRHLAEDELESHHPLLETVFSVASCPVVAGGVNLSVSSALDNGQRFAMRRLRVRIARFMDRGASMPK